MHKNRLVTVFLIILVDLIGFGVILPLLPFYASDFGATPVQVGLLYSVFSVAQLVFSPIWGNLSDRIDKRICHFDSIKICTYRWRTQRRQTICTINMEPNSTIMCSFSQAL